MKAKASMAKLKTQSSTQRMMSEPLSRPEAGRSGRDGQLPFKTLDTISTRFLGPPSFGYSKQTCPQTRSENTVISCKVRDGTAAPMWLGVAGRMQK